MRIAICEDNQEDLSTLRTMVGQYCASQQVEAEICCFSRCETLVEAYEKGDYQIIFLDVFLGGMTGVEAARQIRQIDEEAAIIFVTVSPDFAAGSYFLNAAFYLIKPIKAENLALAMGRCQGLIWENSKFIQVAQGKNTANVRLRDIIYIDSHRNDCIIHTPGGELRVRTSLAHLEAKVGGFPFLRCHQSFLVNLNWVADLRGKGFCLGGEVVIPISKPYYSSCKAQFNRFVTKKTRGEP